MSHSAGIRCRHWHWFILFRLPCRPSPSLTNLCKYKGTDLRSLSVMVMDELQTEVQSECMTTLERSKSKNGSLIPFVSALVILVLKSACPIAHITDIPGCSRTENGCNVADMKHLFQWAVRLEAQLLLFKGLWMEYGNSTSYNVSLFVGLSTPSCEMQHHRVLDTTAPNFSSTCVEISQHII